ncbi:MAG: MarR family winged helix-turn-helix transcriptional regulator [Rhodothalassiaceae bacterium]
MSLSPQPSLYLRDEEIGRALELFLFAHDRVAGAAAQLLQIHDLTPGQQRVLHLLARRPGLSVGRLQALTGVSKQALHRLTRPLLERGLITIRPSRDDRRRRLVALTETGRAVERQLFQALRARLAQAFRATGPEQVGGFWSLLSALLTPEERALLESAPGER